MKLLTNLAGEIGRIVNDLAISSKEKKALETSVVKSVVEYLDDEVKGRLSIVESESRGIWLQRAWRPIVMLVFTFIILLGVFVDLPLLKDSSQFWDLLELGLGGYVIGRSAEKITGGWFKMRKI